MICPPLTMDSEYVCNEASIHRYCKCARQKYEVKVYLHNLYQFFHWWIEWHKILPPDRNWLAKNFGMRRQRRHQTPSYYQTSWYKAIKRLICIHEVPVSTLGLKTNYSDRFPELLLCTSGHMLGEYLFFCGVGLTSPGTAPTSGLLYSPRW
jgi:hypothetical protein